MPSDARMLIAIRVVVVTTLLLAALIIQYTVRELLPINYLYPSRRSRTDSRSSTSASRRLRRARSI